MSKRYSVEQWAAWVAEQRESGLSVRDFCDWIGVSQNAFYLWRRKLAAEMRELPVVAKGSESQRADDVRPLDDVRSLFVPLGVVGHSVIEIDLGCGAVVRVPNEHQSLRRVLGILIEAGLANQSGSGEEARS